MREIAAFHGSDLLVVVGKTTTKDRQQRREMKTTDDVRYMKESPIVSARTGSAHIYGNGRR